jgi:eukaryotic-like serine/threonine-protein kinase
MGAVWAATHTITGGRVALKFIKSANDNAETKKRFLREARAATLVEHPNVVTIRDLFDHEDTPVIVMDLLQGETLASLLSREGKLPLGDAARLILPVIAAVGAAHEAGLIHRDLKPENVFLSRGTQGTQGETVRVLDFGVAKLIRKDIDEFASTAVTQSGSVIGTPAYMAPEQLFGEKDLDHRVDIWSIGVILFEMLAGRRPIDGENFGQLAKKMLTKHVPKVTEFREDVPDDVVTLLTQMLARERGDRLRDLREAATILARHGSVASPTFGAPRDRPLEESDENRVIVGTGTDPNARTVAGAPRTTDPNAQTLLAGSAPRNDTSTAHTASTIPVSRSWQGYAIALGLVAAIAIAATRLIPSSPTTPPAPVPAAPSLLASPLPPPVSMATPEPPPVAPLPPPVTATTAAVAPSATGKPAATAAKATKLIPSATPSMVASVIAPPPPLPPAVSTTSGSGLVTKPPF